MEKLKAFFKAAGQWLVRTMKTKSFIKNMIGGAMITAAVCWLSISRGRDVLFALCDGFFVSGLLLLCFAGLVFSSHQGTFDIFSYGISHLFNVRWPGFSTMSEEHQKEKFADYRMRVSAKRKYPFGLLLSAIFFSVIAVILILIYFNR